MKTAKVITVGSSAKESLGAMKLARWLSRTGFAVEEGTSIDPLFESPCDLFAFSCVFSWHLPKLVEMVRWAKDHGEVWIGGPAVTFHAGNAAFVHRETGIKPILGIDERFEREPGSYPMVYFSRGCPAYSPACGHCPVPAIEGTKFRFYRDAEPAKLLLDNNLSALPDDYQDFIIAQYAERWNLRRGLVDCNSGFEPHSFTEATLDRWERFPLACWRFGYDDMKESAQSREMMRLLKARGYKGEKVRVYTMIGNEPMADCQQRIREVIEAGFHPWPQRLRPLDWRGGPLPCKFDWDEPTLIACQRFYSIAGLWKRMKPEAFHYQGRYPLAI